MKAKHFLIITILSLMAVAESKPADRAAQRVHSSEQAAMADLIYVVDPIYPGDVKISGKVKVVLRIVIDKQGHVIEANLVSGHPILAGAAIDAVRQWKFRPYFVEKEPVEVETRATVEFSADPPQVATPKPRPPQKLRVSRAVAEGLLIRRVDPQYPREAMSKGIQGDVVLQATITREGNVGGLKFVSGDALLVEAAKDAVRQWKYRPYLLNGEPVEIETSVLVRFHLSPNPTLQRGGTE